jgi:capsular exopolysaccharide synthesis family protein
MSRSLVKQSAALPDGLEPRLVTLLTPIAFEAEPYRILGYLVTQMRKDVGLHVVALSSPSGGDGKTTTALNLAGLLAQDPGVRVLLVEAELRLPKVMVYLGLRHTGKPGLAEAMLEPSLTLEGVVQQHPSFDFDVIPAGRAQASPYDLLKLPRLGELLAEARRRYDCIIVDTPPLVPFADCRLLEKWVDGFLVVVAAHKTPRRLLEEALKVMDPAKIVGLVFNRDEQQTPGHYYASHYYAQSLNGQRQGRRFFWRRRTK